MADDPEEASEGTPEAAPGGRVFDVDAIVEFSEDLIRLVEIAAAYVLVFLFAIGVFDLGLRIAESVAAAFEPGVTEDITDPNVVIGFIDTALLLFIIVEIYQTVVAYTQTSGTQQIVRLVIYAGIIAMVRKAIIFRTGSYDTLLDALTAAASYTSILLGLGAVLYVTYRYAPDPPR